MGKHRAHKGQGVTTKSKGLGYNALQLLDAIQMANTQVMYHASAIATNDLTKEGIYKAIALILKEAAEVQRAATEIKYLGK